VVSLDDFHVGIAILERFGGHGRKLHGEIHRETHAGRPEDGDLAGGGAEFFQWRFAETGRGHDERNLLLPAGFDDRPDGGGHGEIDDDLGGRVQSGGQRHAQGFDPGNGAGVFAQSRMLGRIDGGNQRKLRIGGGQGNQSLSHPSCGPVDSDAK
jgi:hypothetical protein